MATRFSTDEVCQKDKFAYWREAVCNSYVQLSCESDYRENFSGEIILNRLSKISASFVSGSNQIVQRRASDIAQACDASFLVSLQVEKQSTIEQRGKTAHLKPGDFALYSSTDPYVLTLPHDFRQLVIQIPRDILLRRLPNADILTGQRVSGANKLNSMLSGCLLTFAQSIELSSPIVQHCMQDTIVDLVATGLASLEASALELSNPERQLFINAKSYIQHNIADPDLDRTLLAKAVGVSVRRLSDVFKNEGTPIATQIRKVRLKRIASDLADMRFDTLSISNIAMRWGVNNFQHFSKTFRDQYAMSPREYRQQARFERDCAIT